MLFLLKLIMSIGSIKSLKLNLFCISNYTNYRLIIKGNTNINKEANYYKFVKLVNNHIEQ